MISAGHRPADIRRYTLRQVREFLAAVERSRRQTLIGEAVAARIAQADGKAFKGYLEALGKD